MKRRTATAFLALVIGIGLLPWEDRAGAATAGDAWSAPAPVAPGRPGSQAAPAIAVRRDGLVAVWVETTPDGDILTWAARPTGAAAWGAPQPVARGVVADRTTLPALAALPDGTVVAVWAVAVGANQTGRLLASTLPAGGTSWSAPESLPVEPGVAFGQGNVPRLAAGADGAVYAVWTGPSADGAGTSPVLARRRPGGTWDAPTPARTTPARPVTVDVIGGSTPTRTDYTGGVLPAVATLPDGRVAVVWYDDEATLDRSGAGAWDVAFGVWNPTTGHWTASASTGADRVDNTDLQPLAVAGGPTGVRLVYRFGPAQVRWQTLAANGTAWSAPATIPGLAGTRPFDLKLAAGGDGTLLLTWRAFTVGAGTEDVAAALLPAGATVWTPLPAAVHFATSELYDPVGALDPAGHPAVLYVDNTHTPTVVMATTFGPTSPATAAAGGNAPGVTGNAYTSPIYGYRLTWAAPWQVDTATSDPAQGYDFLQLSDGVSTVYVQGYPFTGDAQTCVARAAAHYKTDPGYSKASPATDQNGNPLRGGDATRTYAVYTYTYTYQNGSSADFASYLECRIPTGGKAAVVVTQVVPVGRYNDEVATMRALLAGLQT